MAGSARKHRIAENNELLAEFEALRRQMEERHRRYQQAIENLHQLGRDRPVIRAQAHPQRGQPEAPAP